MAQLSQTNDQSTADVHLTTLGAVGGWVWSVGGVTNNQSGGPTYAISLVGGGGTVSGGGGSNPRAFDWSDGTPDASGLTASATFVTSGSGAGWTADFPADTDVRTMSVWSRGDVTGQLTITAHLSDSSAADVSHQFSYGASDPCNMHVTYAAGSAGQTLTITVICDSGNFVAMTAATVESDTPGASSPSPDAFFLGMGV